MYSSLQLTPSPCPSHKTTKTMCGTGHQPNPNALAPPTASAAADDEVLIPQNLCAVLHAKGDLRIEDRPIVRSQLRAGYAVVRMVITGICGSDLSSFLKASVGGADLQGPMVLGHECAGIVHMLPPGQEVGYGGVKVGDRVAVKPGLPCLKCKLCREGYQNRCTFEEYFAHPPTDGGMCQYFVARQDTLLALPTSVSWLAAGALQPLAIAVQVARRASLHTPHQSIAILGAGPIGQLVCALARAYGSPKHVLLLDVDAPRLAFSRSAARSKSQGPDSTLCIREYDDAYRTQRTEPAQRLADARALARSILFPSDGSNGAERYALDAENPGFDTVLECSGGESAAMLGVELLKKGGTYVQVGLGSAVQPFNLLQIAMKELTAVGVLRYNRGCFEDALDLLQRRLVDVDELVTSQFLLRDATKAFEAVRDRKGIKNVVWSFEPMS